MHSHFPVTAHRLAVLVLLVAAIGITAAQQKEPRYPAMGSKHYILEVRDSPFVTLEDKSRKSKSATATSRSIGGDGKHGGPLCGRTDTFKMRSRQHGSRRRRRRPLDPSTVKTTNPNL
jgi:hypothetical protein